MPRTTPTQNPPTATSAPASTATPIEPEDELDETATGDDTPPATRPAPTRREDDEALRMVARLETELACLGRMVDHEGTASLRVVRDDDGAASAPRKDGR